MNTKMEIKLNQDEPPKNNVLLEVTLELARFSSLAVLVFAWTTLTFVYYGSSIMSMRCDIYTCSVVGVANRRGL